MTWTPTEKKAWLLKQGWRIGPRLPEFHSDYEGAFMVIEPHDEGDNLKCRDGENGPWGLVGDDMDELVNEAFEFWTSFTGQYPDADA